MTAKLPPLVLAAVCLAPTIIRAADLEVGAELAMPAGPTTDLYAQLATTRVGDRTRVLAWVSDDFTENLVAVDVDHDGVPTPPVLLFANVAYGVATPGGYALGPFVAAMSGTGDTYVVASLDAGLTVFAVDDALVPSVPPIGLTDAWPDWLPAAACGEQTCMVCWDDEVALCVRLDDGVVLDPEPIALTGLRAATAITAIAGGFLAAGPSTTSGFDGVRVDGDGAVATLLSRGSGPLDALASDGIDVAAFSSAGGPADAAQLWTIVDDGWVEAPTALAGLGALPGPHRLWWTGSQYRLTWYDPPDGLMHATVDPSLAVAGPPGAIDLGYPLAIEGAPDDASAVVITDDARSRRLWGVDFGTGATTRGEDLLVGPAPQRTSGLAGDDDVRWAGWREGHGGVLARIDALGEVDVVPLPSEDPEALVDAVHPWDVGDRTWVTWGHSHVNPYARVGIVADDGEIEVISSETHGLEAACAGPQALLVVLSVSTGVHRYDRFAADGSHAELTAARDDRDARGCVATASGFAVLWHDYAADEVGLSLLADGSDQLVDTAPICEGTSEARCPAYAIASDRAGTNVVARSVDDTLAIRSFDDDGTWLVDDWVALGPAAMEPPAIAWDSEQFLLFAQTRGEPWSLHHVALRTIDRSLSTVVDVWSIHGTDPQLAPDGSALAYSAFGAALTKEVRLRSIARSPEGGADESGSGSSSAAAPTTTDAPAPSGGSDDGAGAVGLSDRGCGCGSTGTRAAWWTLALLLLTTPSARRPAAARRAGAALPRARPPTATARYDTACPTPTSRPGSRSSKPSSRGPSVDRWRCSSRSPRSRRPLCSARWHRPPTGSASVTSRSMATG